MVYWLPHPLQFAMYSVVPLFYAKVLTKIGRCHRWLGQGREAKARWAFLRSAYVCAMALMVVFMLGCVVAAGSMEKKEHRCLDTNRSWRLRHEQRELDWEGSAGHAVSLVGDLWDDDVVTVAPAPSPTAKTWITPKSSCAHDGEEESGSGDDDDAFADDEGHVEKLECYGLEISTAPVRWLSAACFFCLASVLLVYGAQMERLTPLEARRFLIARPKVLARTNLTLFALFFSRACYEVSTTTGWLVLPSLPLTSERDLDGASFFFMLLWDYLPLLLLISTMSTAPSGSFAQRTGSFLRFDAVVQHRNRRRKEQQEREQRQEESLQQQQRLVGGGLLGVLEEGGGGGGGGSLREAGERRVARYGSLPEAGYGDGGDDDQQQAAPAPHSDKAASFPRSFRSGGQGPIAGAQGPIRKLSEADPLLGLGGLGGLLAGMGASRRPAAAAASAFDNENDAGGGGGKGGGGGGDEDGGCGGMRGGDTGGDRLDTGRGLLLEGGPGATSSHSSRASKHRGGGGGVPSEAGAGSLERVPVLRGPSRVYFSLFEDPISHRQHYTPLQERQQQQQQQQQQPGGSLLAGEIGGRVQTGSIGVPGEASELPMLPLDSGSISHPLSTDTPLADDFSGSNKNSNPCDKDGRGSGGAAAEACLRNDGQPAPPTHRGPPTSAVPAAVATPAPAVLARPRPQRPSYVPGRQALQKYREPLTPSPPQAMPRASSPPLELGRGDGNGGGGRPRGGAVNEDERETG
eukprot:CAMPEP_0171819688 /NCGR_PEP_ID=MMETSP0992-20121227/2347_1 /TAXON_ID=483369 /ORGANISM="non described non described, Strain CCMP2098" /LENGTH=744 /DNA_ID=CAMNT_0012433989 /DNA_START=539 /DNA_END=2774 /DNA_ORIENTATION=-